jgi:hypothetical protein
MKFSFSKFVLAPAVLAAAALAANSAMAAETTIKVPFNFTAAGKVCPAGVYTVNRDADYITLTRKGYTESFTWVVGPGSPALTDTKVALKFDEIGKTHVLQSIQYGPVITARLDKKVLQDAERESARLSGGR